MFTTSAFDFIDSQSDDELQTFGVWALIGAIAAVKAGFVGAIFLLGTGFDGDVGALLGQAAMHWSLVTALLVAIPVALARQAIGRSTTRDLASRRQFPVPAGFVSLQGWPVSEG